MEKEFTVGDEVFYNEHPNVKFVITSIGKDGALNGIGANGIAFCDKNPDRWHKTGKYFKEAADLMYALNKSELMEDRTVNIILITKRFLDPKTAKKAIAQYMSEECDCPIETYTEDILLGIIRNAVYDFLFHAKGKRDVIGFVRELTECRFDKMIDNLIIALSQIQVREKDGWEYQDINGWHETEFTRKLDSGEWRLKEDELRELDIGK